MRYLRFQLFLMVLFVIKSSAQNSFVGGTISKDLHYKYAYLYDSNTESLIRTEIIDKKFDFKLEKPTDLKLLSLYFNTRYMKTFAELKDSWDYGSRNKPRLIALEDTVVIVLNDKTQNAIVKGGELNKVIDEMFAAIKLKKYEDFFTKNSNSPISLFFMKTLVQNIIDGFPFISRLDCKLWFNKLSDKMKNTKDGKEISKMFEQLKI